MLSELHYQLALAEVPHIGYVQAKKLTEHFGSAGAVFRASMSELERLEDIGAVRARSIKNFRDFSTAEKELKFIDQYKISALFLSDPQYPQRLLNCYDPPTLLFYKGNADLNQSRMVAIVGTRKNTAYGKDFTESLVEELASCHCIIVSGLAFGIDAIAHKCALKHDIPTVGVVGHGLDTIYPQQHSTIARQMVKHGGLLTEFRSNTKPDKHNFPSRNRVVAGITDATIIVESGVKGGSMITARIANGYHRDVFAVPGRNIDTKSGGCNTLIRENIAMILQEPAQFTETMGWSDAGRKSGAVQKELFVDLTAEEKRLVEMLKEHESLSGDELNFRIGVNASKLAGMLLSLEMHGIVKPVPGNRYRYTDR